MKTERQNEENTTKQGETSKVANLPPGQTTRFQQLIDQARNDSLYE